MQNALLVGLSRQMVLSRQLDVVANNIANINTTGFKVDSPVFEKFLSTSASEGAFSGTDGHVNFVRDRGVWHDFSQGTIQKTGNPLDVAIDGDAFLVVQTPNGERYTRNGALQLNSTGQIVSADGYPVLGTGGPIVIQPNDRDISISADGRVTVNEGANIRTESLRGTLRLVTFAQAQQLQKDGASRYAAPDGVTPQPDTKSRLTQGAIEKSNVNGVLEMSRMIELSRTYSQVSSVLQQQGDMRRNSLQQLADVPN